MESTARFPCARCLWNGAEIVTEHDPMDNLTHSLVGLMIARAGLNRLGPRFDCPAYRGGKIYLMVISSRPVSGALFYFQCHRGWTHALAIAPLLALLPLPIWWLFARKERPGAKAFLYAYLAVFAGIISHLLLDCWNTYGIRIMLPFNSQWYRLDWVYIVDLWIWVILLIGVFAPLLARLVNSEIGAARKKARARRRVAGAQPALHLSLGCAPCGTRKRSVSLESRMYDSRKPQHVAALPGPFVPWSGRGLSETDRAWSVVPVDLLGDFDPDAGRTLPKPETPLPQESAIRASKTGRIFLAFTREPYWRASPSPRLEGGDCRTGLRSPLRASGGRQVQRIVRVRCLGPPGQREFRHDRRKTALIR